MGTRIEREPPDDAWFVVDGHRWAFAPCCAVREDGPRPGPIVKHCSGRQWAWRPTHELGESYRGAVQNALGLPREPPTGPVYFDAAAAPLLRAGWVRRATATVYAIVRGREVVAMVAPLRHWEAGCIDQTGKPAPEPAPPPDWRPAALPRLRDAFGGKWTLRDTTGSSRAYIDGPGVEVYRGIDDDGPVTALFLAFSAKHDDPVKAVRLALAEGLAAHKRTRKALARLGVEA